MSLAALSTNRREELRRIIFEADTPLGKAFDVGLLASIVLSVLAVMVESIPTLPDSYQPFLVRLEWFFTLAFSVEYGLRLYTAPKPFRYAVSFFGIVDLIAIIPTYLSLLVPGAQSLLVVRSLRLLRIFRILKLAPFLGEANVLATALRASTRKVLVFLGTVVILIMILGTAMYLIEGGRNGFHSIPQSMYWAVVTMTTVGYGDVVPITPLGQLLASVVMILGYGIIAIPTGIVTAEIVHSGQPVTTRVCHECMSEGHLYTSAYCRDCGEPLPPAPPPDTA